jgi:GT2 family glycosyltransferase
VSDKPLLSIVVTSYTMERLDDIIELLDSIKAQGYPDIETIYIIEQSVPLYGRINEYAHDSQMASVKVIFSQERLGLSGARNMGIKEATGDVIAFVDDDVVLFPDWAQELMGIFQQNAAIGVTGPGFPKWEDERMAWLPEELHWIVSCTTFAGWDGERPVRTAWGMNMAFRREAFEHCLFSTDFGQTTGGKEAWKAGPVDDAEFSINLRQRTGKEIIYNPGAKVWHNVYKYRLSRRFVRGQCYWQGYTKGLLRRRYPDDADTRALVRERDVLRRILFGLVPRSLIGLFRRPVVSCKTLTFTTYVLFYVAVGYISGSMPWLGRLTAGSFRS